MNTLYITDLDRAYFSRDVQNFGAEFEFKEEEIQQCLFLDV